MKADERIDIKHRLLIEADVDINTYTFKYLIGKA